MMLEILTVAGVLALLSREPISCKPEGLKQRVTRIRRLLNDAHEAKNYAYDQLKSAKSAQEKREWREKLSEEKEAFDELHAAFHAAKQELQEEYDAFNLIRTEISEANSKEQKNALLADKRIILAKIHGSK